ncbi:hypothetical protein ACD591_08540 [Rufibacter glacialis]|uniref:Uncharacterized protein n=1 Tax=Rufibacter glacialis TaxID=1259555 RepID=A0A5M8QBS9_9BACT|nr:hypothetical protein [Rufibacter glacialis]KAA6432511.1 hypothetical protein FOE74_15565 [Rufibacter glacialis]GGK79316.1 hypothetical protein GCM10011405_28980 [Rufibacter glacialis]
MAIFFAFILAGFLGYLYGHRIRPNLKLQKTLKDLQERCKAVLEDEKKGVYKTIVTDNQKSSELVVEVKELAVTEGGQVKVEYLSAFYKNPVFRTRKGPELLQEVHGLLGDYLPRHEVEWYEVNGRHQKIREFVTELETAQKP